MTSRTAAGQLAERERSRERARLRSRRKREVRATSISTACATLAERQRAHANAAGYDAHRVLPLTRGDCEGGPRPCPLASCKHHLALDIHPRTGSIKLNFPDLEVWEMRETCALDVAERIYCRGIDATWEEIGELLNVTREAARLIEHSALRKLRRNAAALRELRELREGGA